MPSRSVGRAARFGEQSSPPRSGRSLIQHIKLIRAGDFHAIKWWQQARMGWSERIVVDDGKPADTPMRVIVELVGEAAPSRVEQTAPRTGSRLSDTAARVLQLVG
jgi:hypothetical protein